MRIHDEYIREDYYKVFRVDEDGKRSLAGMTLTLISGMNLAETVARGDSVLGQYPLVVVEYQYGTQYSVQLSEEGARYAPTRLS